MACICGIIDKKELYIASDSLVVGSIISPGLFVYKKHHILYGVYASIDVIHRLKAEFAPPMRNWRTLESYMSTSFTNEFLQCAKARRIQALIGIQNSLFQLDASYGCIQITDGYAAIGDAADIMLGSFYSTKGLSAQKRITTALYAATKHSILIRPPYTILSQDTYAVGNLEQQELATLNDAETEFDVQTVWSIQ